MNIDNLHRLFLHELRTTYGAERHLIETMPRLATAAGASAAENAHRHISQTEARLKRLEHIAGRVDGAPQRTRSRAMEGLLDEAADLLSAAHDQDARNLVLLTVLDLVRSDLSVRYGALAAWAADLGKTEEARLLLVIMDHHDQGPSRDKPAGAHPAEKTANAGSSIGMGERLTALLNRNE